MLQRAVTRAVPSAAFQRLTSSVKFGLPFTWSDSELAAFLTSRCNSRRMSSSLSRAAVSVGYSVLEPIVTFCGHGSRPACPSETALSTSCFYYQRNRTTLIPSRHNSPFRSQRLSSFNRTLELSLVNSNEAAHSALQAVRIYGGVPKIREHLGTNASLGDSHQRSAAFRP